MENIVKDLNDFWFWLKYILSKITKLSLEICGKDFFVLHSKLEEYYDEVNKQIDEIAEHILMLGEQPLGTMQDYLNNTCIVEAKNEKIEEKAIFENIINDLGTLLNKVTNIKEEADKQNMYATSSLMDEYIEGYMKKLWMCRQRDKGDRS